MSRTSTKEHPDTEALIAYLDAEPRDVQVDQHIVHCDACLQSLDEIAAAREALVDLPLLEAPEACWEQIEASLPVQNKITWLGKSAWAIAASGALLALAVMLQQPLQSPVAVPTNDVLIGETQQLEQALDSLDGYQRPMDLATASRIAGYEDTIRLIDKKISQNNQDLPEHQLWQQRNRLLRGLVAVRAQPMVASYQMY